ncbi:16772_t:CDS:2 [Gigaspora rosea]|nr:16772_t:CDS:2 [Gigaspora rosea]
MKLANDGGGEGCAIEEENKLIDIRCINRKLNKKQIEGVNCKDKPVSDESNNFGVQYENGIEGENGMFEEKLKHDEDRKVFVNDKKDDSVIDLNREEMDGVIEVVDALLDVVMKTEKQSIKY